MIITSLPFPLGGVQTGDRGGEYDSTGLLFPANRITLERATALPPLRLKGPVMFCKALPVLVAAALLGAAPVLAGSAADSGPLAKALFGKLPAKGSSSVCFTRLYSPAHLAGHPQQNVRDMVILMTATADADAGAVYKTRIGVHFRKVGPAFETGGGCGLSDDGKTIACGADCDGGSMDVVLKDGQTILLKIPDGASLWRPGAEASDNPKAARFGQDDKIFKLTRGNLRQCLGTLGKE